jgi:hypothetical protein
MGAPQVEQYMLAFLSTGCGQAPQSETDDSACMFPLKSNKQAQLISIGDAKQPNLTFTFVKTEPGAIPRNVIEPACPAFV